MQTIKFGLEEFEPVTPSIDEDYEQVKADRFTKVKIKLFGDGENAHTEPVDFSALKKSADSAYDIPLIAELNPYRSDEDFGGHGTLTGKEFSFGFVKESKDNPIVFEKDEKGKTFITLYGLIWNKYFKNVVDIIRNNHNKVEVSVELDIVKGRMSKRGKPLMEQFVLNAITFLGQITTAACPGASAELCFSTSNDKEYQEDKNKYINKYFAENIKIDNSKESSVDGKWTNPRNKLLNPILKAINKKPLLNEAYLMWKEKEEVTLSDVSYPHHVIKNGKLVLHIKGVQSAFSRLAQQGEVKGEPKEHLLRHYRELGLNTENFEEFGLSAEEFALYFAKEYGKEESNLEFEEKELEQEIQEETIQEECTEVEVLEEAKTEEDLESEEKEAEEKTATESENTEENSEEEDEEEMSTDDGIPPEAPLEKANEVNVEELLERLQKLEDENKAYLSKIEEMSDYEELKKFKEDTEKEIAQAQEMAEMKKVLESMELRGVSIDEDTKTQLCENRHNFANLDAWSNYVKAYAFDNCEKTQDGIVSFEMPLRKEEENNAKYGVWASLMKK